MRRLVKRLTAKDGRIHFCRETGPTGCGLHRLITDLRYPCTVVVPSLIPRTPGDRVRTHHRDVLTLAKFLRAGELTRIRMSDEGHEVMRDRARATAVESLRVHRRQVGIFILKHGRVDARKTGLTKRYLRWLQEQRFEHPVHPIDLQERIEAVRIGKERVARIEAAIAEFVLTWSLGPVVGALQTLRGGDLIVAVNFATEIGDVICFESLSQLMGYLGLVPSERSPGDTVRRNGITKAGNGSVRHVLVESA